MAEEGPAPAMAVGKDGWGRRHRGRRLGRVMLVHIAETVVVHSSRWC